VDWKKKRQKRKDGGNSGGDDKRRRGCYRSWNPRLFLYARASKLDIPNFEPEYPAITRMAQSVSLYPGMSVSSGFVVISAQKLHSASIHGLFNNGHNFVITGHENMNNYLNAMVNVDGCA